MWPWLDASDRIDSWVTLKILQASMNHQLEVWQEVKCGEISAPLLNMNVPSDKKGPHVIVFQQF